MSTERHHALTQPARQRRTVRLGGYDYAAGGAYFVTVCTSERGNLFGNIADGQMRLNQLGLATKDCWLEIPAHFPHVALDEYVIMPNHVHGILWIVTEAEDYNLASGNLSVRSRPAFHSPSRSLGSVLRGFKIGVTRWARAHSSIHQVWQRSYYEHIIRNDASLNRIRRYILDNPANWEHDPENPDWDSAPARGDTDGHPVL